MNVIEMIRKLCKQKGISVTTLEKELGYSNGSLSKSGAKSISATRLMEVAKYFGVSMEYLMGSEDIVYNSDDREWEYYDNLSKFESLTDSRKELYYHSGETVEMAQKIFEYKELRLLFDAAQDADPEDLQAVHAMLLALKRKENH